MLQKGTTKAVIQENIKELVTTKPSATRAKAIKTLAKRRGISKKEAQAKQAVAIAYSQARRSRGARPPHARVSAH